MRADESWIWVDFAGSTAELERLQGELDETGSCGAEEHTTAGAARLRMYWPATRGVDSVLATAHAGAAVSRVALVGHGLQRSEDWLLEWKRHFTALRLSARLWVAPPWSVPEVSATEQIIIIEPGMAFGTGHHPTTRMCAALLEDVLQPGDTVLDVGCGSAILSIAAAKLGATSVLGLDTDPEAIEVARGNVRLNCVEGQVRLECADLREMSPVAATLVVANIITQSLVPLLPSLAAAASGGHVLLSGVGVEHRSECTEALERVGLRLVEERNEGEWCAFACRPTGA